MSNTDQTLEDRFHFRPLLLSVEEVRDLDELADSLAERPRKRLRAILDEARANTVLTNSHPALDRDWRRRYTKANSLPIP